MRNKQGSVPVALTPRVSSGTAAPNTTPSKVGDMYVDTQAGVAYIAVGTGSSAGWKQVTNG